MIGRTTGRQEQAENGATTANAQVPYVVKIKPGTAAEKSMKFILPAEMRNNNIESVIKYAMGLGEEDMTREGMRIKEKIGMEMRAKFGLYVNGQGITGSERLGEYFVQKKSESGNEYLEAEIIVAARQEGARRKGLEYLIR